jgi:hypothetical protein
MCVKHKVSAQPRESLLREVQAAEERLEAGVGAEGVKG